MRRAVSWLLAVACGAMPAPAAVQEPASAESGIATGVRQVEEGDFEGAVTTLESAIARLRGDPQRVRLLVQADIQLAVAHVALDHTAQAVQVFTEALTLDPNLRLPPDRFSPKVLSAFETAREQSAHRTAGPGGRKTHHTGLIVGATALAAAGTVAVVKATGGTKLPTFGGARFGTPARDCPNGSDNVHLPFTILVEASNPSGDPVPINSVSTVVTIEVSPAFPGEIGFPSSQLSTVVPSSVPAKQNVTLEISSFLICGNGEGDPGRFNEWSGRVTLTTSAGVVMLPVADRMRVSLP